MMGFELFGDRGKWLNRFISARGLVELDKALQKRPNRWPEFNMFMENGEAIVTPGFIAEIKDFIEAHRTKSNRRCVSFMVRDIANYLLGVLERNKSKKIRFDI